jgi:hypothetical protein
MVFLGDPNMFIYHMRTLTTSSVEFGRCTLYMDVRGSYSTSPLVVKKVTIVRQK